MIMDARRIIIARGMPDVKIHYAQALAWPTRRHHQRLDIQRGIASRLPSPTSNVALKACSMPL